MQSEFHISPNAEALAAYARDWLVALITRHHANSTADRFTLALSGGSTPKRLYQLLAQLPPGTIDWSRVVLLWGDERNVPADHADSNYRMVRESLLQHIDIPASNVLSVPHSGSDARLAADAYQALLQHELHWENGFPTLDCVLLGIGDDVHTASLFPGTAALHETERAIVANHVPQLDCWRITFTAPLINRARHVAFLLSGSGKQPALDQLWHADYQPEQYPSQLIRPSAGQLWFLADRAAIGDIALP